MTLMRLAPGDHVGGEFEIVRPLGEGGMGAVYVARQLSTGKERALKVMQPALLADERSRQRFVEEAKVGSRIESDHVVEVIGAGVDEASGAPWLAMELLQGEDLEAHVARCGPLDVATLARLYDELAHALDQAHAQGIIHRDLKPENLFLAQSRRRAQAPMLKVLDFGIATFVASDATAATVTTAIGSPLWIAPEQASVGAKLRPATDVWAMGLIAFFLLTGRRYWRAANAYPINLHALIAEILTLPVAPASERARELGACVPAGFDAWFARCVARVPTERFATAGEAVAALDALAASEAADAAVEASDAGDALGAAVPAVPVPPTVALEVSPPEEAARASPRVARTEPLKAEPVPAPRVAAAPPSRDETARRPLVLAIGSGLVAVGLFAWLIVPSGDTESLPTPLESHREADAQSLRACARGSSRDCDAVLAPGRCAWIRDSHNAGLRSEFAREARTACDEGGPVACGALARACACEVREACEPDAAVEPPTARSVGPSALPAPVLAPPLPSAPSGPPARLRSPSGLAVGPDGSLYVADTGNHRVRMIRGEQVITLAGSGASGSRDGPGSEATFSSPRAVAVASDGTVYVGEARRVRAIREGRVTTVAGVGDFGARTGPALRVELDHPSGLAVAPDGAIYVADTERQRIVVVRDGRVEALAGRNSWGSTDGRVGAASFAHPHGLALGPDGSLYVADTGNHFVRRIRNDYVDRVAGSGMGMARHEDGAATTEARFASPEALAVAADGAIYVADSGNCCVRRVFDGVVSSIGRCGARGLFDGPVAEAQFDAPRGIALGPAGEVYVADARNHRIRVIHGGRVETFAGLDAGDEDGTRLAQPPEP